MQKFIEKYLRVISLSMAMILVLNLIPNISMAQQMNDINNHWAANQIQVAVDGGYVKGYENNFRPNDYITKAEFTTLLNRYFGYSKAGESSFLDVSENKWYSEQIKIADLAGYIVKNENRLFKPEEEIRREEVVVMLGNIIKIEPQATNYLGKFIDGEKVSPVYREKINAMVAAGYLAGRDGNKLSLDQRITRAEAVTLIYKVASQIYDKKGTYGGVINKKVIDHNVLVNTEDVILKNMEIRGDLYLSAGIGDGDVTLDNVVVMGKTIVEGGGSNSITLKDTVLQLVEINKIGGNVRLLAQNNTNIKKVRLLSGAKLEEALSNEAKGFQKVDVGIITPNQIVNINGNIDHLLVGDFANEHTIINITPTATIMNMEFKKAVQVSKTGNIKKAVIKVNGVKLEQKVANVQLTGNATSAEIQGKKIEKLSSSASGKSSGKKKKKKNSNNKQPIPQIQLSKINLVSDDFNCYLVDIAVNQSIEQTVHGSIASADKSKMYFVQPFENLNKGLMFYFGDDLKVNKGIPTLEVSKLPEFKAGIYSADEGNKLTLETENVGVEKRVVRFIAGDNDTEKVIPVGKYLFSIPGTSSIDTGVTLSGESEYVGGLTLNLKDTKSSYADDDESVRFTAINATNEKFEDLIIENNILDFGKESLYVTNGIRSFAPTKGTLLIKNNTVQGYNIGKENRRPNNGSAAISIIDRIKVEEGIDIRPEIKIIGNNIKNTAYHGIALNQGEVGKISIIDNEMDNIGQNGVIVSKFGGYNNIIITGNNIKSFGTRKIMKKKDWNDDTLIETNSSEFGIWYQFIDDNYGIRLNDKWLNTLENISDELTENNEIANKKQNDTLNGVLDSNSIGYDRADRNFMSPIVYINSYEEKYNGDVKLKDHIVIYKENNDDVTYGYDPEKPGKTIKVKSLKIIGPGAGKVNLSGNLIVEGDLVIDLPNANLLNSAEVQGETDIKNIKSLDSSDATFEVVSGNQFTIAASDDKGLIIDIKNVINGEEKKLEKSQTILTGNIDVIVADKVIDATNYTIDDELDRLTIKKAYLDTFKESTLIKLKYIDKANKVSLVQSAAIEVTINDESSAEVNFGSENTFEFTYKAAPDKGAQLYVKNIKDKFGNIVSKEDTILKDNVSIANYMGAIESSNYDIDDENDIITIKKSFLDTLDSTSSSIFNSLYGKSYDVTIKDESNNVNEITSKVEFRIINRSNAGFEFLSEDIFTNGNAPEAGITFAIKDIKNHRGESVSASESNLKDGILVKTFPFDWLNAEEDEVTGQFGLPKANYVIDDEKDTLTIKKEYLDTLKLGTPKLDEGRLYFTIEYYDSVHHTQVRSPKLFISVKAAQAPRDKSTIVTSKDDVFEVINTEDTHEIKGNSLQITTSMRVGDFIDKIKRDNERQRLRVYGSEDVSDGNILATNKNNYKADYMSLYENDVLLVTAEDGVTEMLYAIEVKTISQVLEDNIAIKDTDIVESIENRVVTIKNKVTISELEQALELKGGVNLSFRTANNKEITNKETIIGARTKLVISLGDDRVSFKILVGGAPVYRALLVGNWDYPGDKQDLVGPHNDLELLEKTMKSSRFDGGTKITSIVKVENRLKSEIFADIENTFRNIKDNDVSYFYYSGHGTRDKTTNISYLCTVSEDHNDFISVHELERELSKLPGKKVVILDSCNSGGFIDKEFVAASINDARYFNDGIIKSFKANKRNYLNGNDFKVLTASSANEYSYESKVEKLGKFTKALCEGGGLDGKFLADKDNNNEVTLMEAYNYLDNTISSTSHIQVYPYNDDFVILGNTSGDDTELNNSTSISAGSKYKIINDSQRAVMSQDELIHDHIKVKDFLANIIKDHEEQVLEVYPAGTKIDELSNKKSLDDNLAKEDFLLVRAEDGTQVFYSIILEAYEDKSKSVFIKASIDYTINADNGNIESMMTSITNKMTVENFLSYIIKDHKEQKLYIFSEGADTNKIEEAKIKTDKLKAGDKLLVVSPDNTINKIYSIILKEVSVTDEKDHTLSITSDNYQIIDNPEFEVRPIADKDGKIDTNTTVEVFLSKIKKDHNMQELYVFEKDADTSNKENAKATSDKMVHQDKLLVVAEDKSERVYIVTVTGVIPDIILPEEDGTLTIQSDVYKVTIITNVVYGIGPDGPFSTEPNTNTTVETFISNIIKGHENQNLYVFAKGQDQSDYKNAKAMDDKMENMDVLLVVAENGTKQAYTVAVKSNVDTLKPHKPANKSDSVEISSSTYIISSHEMHGDKIMPDSTKDEKLDTNTTVETFLNNINKNNKGQMLYVFAKDADTSDDFASKDNDEKMANEDILVIIAEDNIKRKEFTVLVQEAKEEVDTFTGDIPSDESSTTTSSAATTVNIVDDNNDLAD